eukprot:s2466_g4.t1
MVFKTQQYFGVYHPRKSMTTWLQCREQTGVPGIPSKAEMKAAIKLAGPGKPYDMKPLKKYEEIALVLQHHSVPVIFCAAGLLTMAAAALVSKHRMQNRAIRMATAELGHGHSMEERVAREPTVWWRRSSEAWLVTDGKLVAPKGCHGDPWPLRKHVADGWPGWLKLIWNGDSSALNAL